MLSLIYENRLLVKYKIFLFLNEFCVQYETTISSLISSLHVHKKAYHLNIAYNIQHNVYYTNICILSSHNHSTHASQHINHIYNNIYIYTFLINIIIIIQYIYIYVVGFLEKLFWWRWFWDTRVCNSLKSYMFGWKFSLLHFLFVIGLEHLSSAPYLFIYFAD